MGSKFTSDMLLNYVKVNRKRVVTALYWLKEHHSDYADIEIKEENLAWMKGEEESNAIEHISDINMDNANDSNPDCSVLKMQCFGDKSYKMKK